MKTNLDILNTRAMRAETNSGWSRNWSKSVAFLSMNTETTVKKRFPPAQVEYVEKQPTLEEIFLAIIGKKEEQ